MEPFGKYELRSRIGAGGMAEVFLARGAAAQGLGKLLVIKKIHPAFARSTHFVRMFIDEAKIALGLNHPCVVQVFDFGQVGSTFFLAMEHVEGVDLLRLMQEGAKIGRRVPYGLSAFIVHEVCRGLDYAHRKADEYGDELHIVHRDVSPQNVLVSWDGSVKLTDFGIARARDVEEEDGVVKGKFAYMSPEQARGLPVDRRSDVYSAGVVLFELACARPLHAGRGKEVLEAVRSGAIPRPRDHDPGLPSALEDIILRALAYHPDDRFQTARDFQHALARFQHAHAETRGEIYDSGTLAQFVAQTVPRERRARASGEHPVSGEPRLRPAAPDPATTPAAKRSASAPPSPAAPHDAVTPDPSVPPAAPTRERKQVLVIEGELRGLGAPRAVADFVRMAGDVAWKHDAWSSRPATPDGFTFVVGVPVAGDDDASQAIRLALALVDALDSASTEVEPGLRLAIGIERGSALVTRTIGASWTCELQGDTRSFARRLAAQARGGEILVGGEVFRVARRDWSFEELAAIALDDGARARVHRLRGAKERAERMRERGPMTSAELVGRELELKALRDAYREACASRRKHHALVIGEEGVGKRSLVGAFLASVPPDEATVLRAACRAATADAPFAIVADLARDLLGLAEGAEPREILRRLRAGAALVYPEAAADAPAVDELVATMARLLGVGADSGTAPDDLDADERRARIVAALRSIETRLASDRPLIVLIEDVHWADSQSWDVIWALIQSPSPTVVGQPILGIATARPDERIVQALRDTPATLVVALDELGADDRARLIAARFQDGEDVGALSLAITAQAGGNPFYIGEVLDSLVERGILGDSTRAPGKLTWKRRDAAIVLPTSALALVTTRLDRLAAAEKEVVSRAAIFGRAFAAGDVAALVGRPIDDELAALSRRALIETRGPQATFRNDLTQRAAIELIPADVRVELHRRAADILARGPGHRAGQDDAIVARHLEHAGDRTGAARRYLRAAQHARDVRGNVEAHRHLTRALELLPEGAHGERYSARSERAGIFAAWGQRGRQLRDLARMRRHAGALADAGKIAETLSRLGQLYVDAGKLAAARAVLAPAAEAALLTGSPLAQAEVLRVEAVLDRSTGDNAAALDRCDRALALCGLEGRAPLLQRAQILVIKGTVLWYLSRLHEATLAHGEALVIYRKLRVPRQEARALNNIGIVFSALGDFEEALSSYKRALRIDQELGDRAQVAVKLANIGQVYVECGDTDRAEAYLKKALALAEQLGDSQVAADASITLGQAYLKRGEILRARKVLEHGLAVATSLRESYQEIRGRLYLALARLECGDSPERAVAEARLAGELARKAPLPIGEIYSHVVAALALARLGRPHDAEGAAATAIQRLDETGAHEGADEVLYVHARLARAAGLDARAEASLARAVGEVQTRARRMKDPEMRRIYLAAAPARDILVAAGAQGPE